MSASHLGRFMRAAVGERDAAASPLAHLLDDWSVLGAVLVDVDSGLALASLQGRAGVPDLELVGAAHADLVRDAVGGLGALHPSGPPTELVVSHDGNLHHLVRTVADPYGGLLALAVLVSGSARTVTRMRRRLRRIDGRALVPRPVSARPAHSAGDPQPRAAAGPAPVSRRRAPHDPLVPSGRPVADRPAVPPETPARAPLTPTLPLPPVRPARAHDARPQAGGPAWFTPGVAPPDARAPVPRGPAAWRGYPPTASPR